MSVYFFHRDTESGLMDNKFFVSSLDTTINFRCVALLYVRLSYHQAPSSFSFPVKEGVVLQHNPKLQLYHINYKINQTKKLVILSSSAAAETGGLSSL